MWQVKAFIRPMGSLYRAGSLGGGFVSGDGIYPWETLALLGTCFALPLTMFFRRAAAGDE